MLKITSREYKVMLNSELFSNREIGLRILDSKLDDISKSIKGLSIKGNLKDTVHREIKFLDTVDNTLLHSGLIFRYRQLLDNQTGELTIKCRLPDRYIASHTNLDPAKGIEGKRKFEEDISTPFNIRFSHSMTIKFSPQDLPASLKSAGKYFPLFKNLSFNDQSLDPQTPLKIVNHQLIHEHACLGKVLNFKDDTPASIALLLWYTHPQGKVECAELSFRIEDKNENYSLFSAQKSLEFYQQLQSWPSVLINGLTKTQFAYQS